MARLLYNIVTKKTREKEQRKRKQAADFARIGPGFGRFLA
jgi:hypothetical protein